MPGFALDKLKPWIHRSARVSKKSSLPMARGLAPASPIEAFGLPPRPQGMNAREYAISLLRAGAEIEHSFLVQYLYAAYSVDERSISAPARNREIANSLAFIPCGRG